jgi:hypothetical protein
MSSRTRLGIAIVFGVVLMGLTTVVAGTAVVYRSGSVSIEVEPRDGRGVSLRLPAGLLDLALAATPSSVFDELAHEMGREARDVWPIVDALADELDACPDATFVEVHRGGEHVTIAKRRGRFVIRVDTPYERVRLAFPIGTARRVVDRIGASMPAA